MGSNLTEEALQRAVRSMSTFDRLCQKFNVQSDVPVITTAHSTRSNEVDIKKVVKVILQQKILKPSDDGRKPSIHFNPLYLWNEEKTIEGKKKQYQRYRNKYRDQDFDCEEEDDRPPTDDNDIQVTDDQQTTHLTYYAGDACDFWSS